MVGDRKFDMIGGRKHGIVTVAALFGYGTEEELRNENPDFTVRSVGELSRFFGL